MAISGYKAPTSSKAETGILPYISPEAGAGYIITSWFGVSGGAGFDMLIFANGDMHTNITPFIKASFWF